ncbi:hypothetical protein V2J09_017130 [Rumex salicifolius]
MEMKKDEKKQQMKKVEGREMLFHVLAVDDSKIERKILEKLLSVSSYKVTSVESGDKALEFLGLLEASPSSCQQEQGGSMKVNLIMTDYSMPGMTGYDLLKRVKLNELMQESSWKDVPVIVMSSENVPSRIHMCLEEGAEEFLLKPVQMSDLKKLQDYVTRSLIRRRSGDEDDDRNPKAGICLIEGHVVTDCEDDSKEEEGTIELESSGNFSEMEMATLDRLENNIKEGVFGLALV